MNSISVLLVDDEPVNLLVMERALRTLGHRLVTAASAREALNHLLTEEPAVVLLDVRLPDMNGFEAAALIRSQEGKQHLPIIFVTALEKDDEAVRRGYALGAVDYIFKPIVPEILCAKVAVFLELRQLRDGLEQRVTERTAELRDAVTELETFADSVAHNLRAPLRAMRGFSDALQEDYADQLDAIGRAYTHRIGAAAVQMDELIEDILDYTRLTLADMQLQPVRLGAAVRAALGPLHGEIEGSGAQVDVAEPLPEVVGDWGRLVQVVQNLVANAVKFVRPGVSPQVRIWAEPCQLGAPRPGVRLWIEDNGIGIAANHQVRIFGVFERLHGQETYPGTGIGLAIVRRAMIRMGGRVGVESEPEHGSRFWLELAKA